MEPAPTHRTRRAVARLACRRYAVASVTSVVAPAADALDREREDAQALRPEVEQSLHGPNCRTRGVRAAAPGYATGRMAVPEGFEPFPGQGPFVEWVGPVHVREGADGLVLGIDTEQRHANHRGTVQGGMLTTFADFALGRAIEADAGDGKDRATVSLTIDFLKPAQPGDWIEARSQVDRVGGTLSFADCTLTVGERVIARARAVWVVAS